MMVFLKKYSERKMIVMVAENEIKELMGKIGELYKIGFLK